MNDKVSLSDLDLQVYTGRIVGALVAIAALVLLILSTVAHIDTPDWAILSLVVALGVAKWLP